ncbi:hypothetical protein LZ30DRAFT_391583 [Colletotrichum cereale]|nr:hypothetical protein LZ30DRAFT_391583 [Colletotrichum cereale]
MDHAASAGCLPWIWATAVITAGGHHTNLVLPPARYNMTREYARLPDLISHPRRCSCQSCSFPLTPEPPLPLPIRAGPSSSEWELELSPLAIRRRGSRPLPHPSSYNSAEPHNPSPLCPGPASHPRGDPRPRRLQPATRRSSGSGLSWSRQSR